MTRFTGLDGGSYDNGSDVRAANNRYLQQQKQNELLKEQNKILKVQEYQRQFQLEKDRQLEYDKLRQNQEIENQKRNIQLMQMEHEKEMRILKLFDNVGISKNTFDMYLYKNIFTKEYYSITEKINDNLTYIDQLKTLLEATKDTDIYFCKVYKNKNMLDLDKKISSECYTIDKNEQEKLRKDLEQLKTKNKHVITYATVITIVSLVISFIGALGDNSLICFLIVPIIVPIVAALVYQKKSNQINTIKFSINKPKLDEEKYVKKLKKMLDNATKELENNKKNLSLLLEKPINNFNEFRFNHYNSDIEKLLIDIEFHVTILNLGFDYPKINNNNKIKNGTVEDYITYFDEYGN